MYTTQSPRMNWPAIPYADWQSSATALHLYLQIIGKYRLAYTPWVNHSWHATLYVRPRGLTTSLIPDGDGIEIDVDLNRHHVRVVSASGASASFPLEPMSVAGFHQRFQEAVARVGGQPSFHGRPNEVLDAIPFVEDTTSRPYDAAAVNRFHGALLAVSRVFERFRTGFRGKSSPVHLFWGSLDLAVTRFSGRSAPLHPGGIPNLPDMVTQEAYSHEVSSAGFWPGGGPVNDAAFYAYAYPQPDRYADAAVKPADATYSEPFGEFVLPYEAVRNSPDPDATLLAFLDATYGAAADLADWDRDALDCPGGLIGVPPPI